MIDLPRSIRAWIIAQTGITSEIATVGGLPAIFDGAVPDNVDITEPVIVIDVPTRDNRSDTSSSVIRDLNFSLRVYALVVSTDGSRSTLALDKAANTLAASLHSARISLLDFEGQPSGSFMGGSVSGPTQAPTQSPSLSGRRISARWLIQET